MAMDYLQRCCELHTELTEIRFGRRQDLDDIERAVAHVRSSRRLTYDDIEKIRDSRVWDADLFGYWPSRTEIESILDPTEWDFWNLPKREDKAIAALIDVFRQIEPASVVLRFIVPDHYGILSPPVETVLGLGPYRRRRDRYKAYLWNLRTLQRDRGLPSAAKADMALWVLQVGLVDGLLREHRDYEMLQEAYKSDGRLRAIQVGNLTSRLFKDLSRSDLAEALLGTNAELAGQIAAIEFERSIKRLAAADPDDSLRDVVDRILGELHLGTEVAVRWTQAVYTRNRAIHPGTAPTEREVRELIKAMREVSDAKTSKGSAAR